MLLPIFVFLEVKVQLYCHRRGNEIKYALKDVPLALSQTRREKYFGYNTSARKELPSFKTIRI